jgi:hypothetical protein
MISQALLLVSLYLLPDSTFKCWDEVDSLGFSDYLGHPEVYQTELGNAKALTFIIFDYRVYFDKEVGEYNMELCVVQDKMRSWLIEKDSSLLRHEQLHFDIAELYGRKVQKLFNGRGEDADIHYIVEQIENTIDQLELVQQNYDRETGHGVNSHKQSEWFNNIKSDLDKFDIDISNVYCQCESPRTRSAVPSEPYD